MIPGLVTLGLVVSTSGWLDFRQRRRAAAPRLAA
jgi:hypothetical protein